MRERERETGREMEKVRLRGRGKDREREKKRERKREREMRQNISFRWTGNVCATCISLTFLFLTFSLRIVLFLSGKKFKTLSWKTKRWFEVSVCV